MDTPRGAQEEAHHIVAVAAAGNLAGEDIAQAAGPRMLVALGEEGTDLGAAGPIAVEGDTDRSGVHHTAADRAEEHRTAAVPVQVRTGLAVEAGHIVVGGEGTAEEDSPEAGDTAGSALGVDSNLAVAEDTDLEEDIGSVVVRSLLDLEEELASLYSCQSRAQRIRGRHWILPPSVNLRPCGGG
jgi:hypothetical protein